MTNCVHIKKCKSFPCSGIFLDSIIKGILASFYFFGNNWVYNVCCVSKTGRLKICFWQSGLTKYQKCYWSILIMNAFFGMLLLVKDHLILENKVERWWCQFIFSGKFPKIFIVCFFFYMSGPILGSALPLFV